MLVDNDVERDSRVQKVARSAARAGWRVTVLGKAPGTAGRRWSIDGAEVRLLPAVSNLAKRRHEFRRRWLIAPLAYPPTGIKARRRQEIEARMVDLRTRRAALPDSASRTARAALVARLAATRLAGKWVWLRGGMLTFGQKARGRLVLPSDVAYTWFWSTVMRERAWRRLEPALWDYELAYGPVIDELAPDLIHAHDFRMLGVGARAVVRARDAGRDVKLVWDAHEFLPGVEPWQRNARWLPGNVAHEREYAPFADAVVTVSAGLSELLRDTHHLSVEPIVVQNAPAAGDIAADGAPDLRTACGVGLDTPLAVYSGVAAAKRGLDVMVAALPDVAELHVALVVANVSAPYVVGLRRRAAALGVGDRLHVVPYVPYDRVVPFLAGADVGVIPIRHFPNHEIALITKFFEYSHARLPIVVSDVKTMADTVRATGQGEVFRADDVADYVRAMRAVLADPAKYRSAYDAPGLLDSWTWEAQAEALDGVYRSLLDTPAGDAADVPAGRRGDLGD
ncbi:MAG TPA: glycosyltransferase family 4 protein [Micromonosporaceae bacterium]|nr:glycosyltransferase family 4 protein [Micromonosporaceae bacterium]